MIGTCVLDAVRLYRSPRPQSAVTQFCSMLCMLVGLTTGLLGSTFVEGGEPRPQTTGDAGKIDRQKMRGIDLDGKLHEFGASSDARAVAFVFLSPQCPISNAIVPTLNDLAAKYRLSGVEFYAVVPQAGGTRSEVAKHREEFGIRIPVVLDSTGHLQRLLRPSHTPQAIVSSPRGDRLYSGRIDNRFSNLGQKRTQADTHDLDQALRSIVSRQRVRVPVTEPVGCLMESPSAAGVDGSVTFNRHIAPILYANCSECHRPGEAAPFTLLCYADASRHANQIAAVTRSRFMPPWHPERAYGQFRHERRLSSLEIDLIQRWIAEGKPEGRPEDHLKPPAFSDGWRLGQPDLVLEMARDFELSASGPDVYQHFVLPTGLRRNRLVSALEFRPGNHRIVHHACFYIDTSRSARRLDSQSSEFGYGSFFGPGFPNVGALRSWLPGMSPERLPLGSGQLLHANSDLVLEIHYQRSGKPERDRSMIGIHFAKSSARRLVYEIQVMNHDLLIPAGVARHEHRASYTLPVDASLLDVAPHMHLLGKEIKASATLPDGRVEPLIWIRNWDFNWQGQYVYAKPIFLPRGTRIDVTAWYDNSSGNPLNPHNPPRAVRWGEQTVDEMGVCHFRYTCRTREELDRMNSHYVEYMFSQQQPSDFGDRNVDQSPSR